MKNDQPKNGNKELQDKLKNMFGKDLVEMTDEELDKIAGGMGPLECPPGCSLEQNRHCVCLS